MIRRKAIGIGVAVLGIGLVVLCSGCATARWPGVAGGRAGAGAFLDARALGAASAAEAAEEAHRLNCSGVVLPLGVRITKDASDTVSPGMSPAARARLRQVLRKAGVDAAGLDLSGVDGVSGWNDAIDLAVLFGIPWMVGEPPPDALDELAARARKRGVMIGIRNGSAESPWKTEAALLAAAKAHKGVVRIWADPVAWLRDGVDPVRAIGAVTDFLGAVYFADVDLTGADGRSVPPGNGLCRTPAQYAVLGRESVVVPAVLTCGEPRHGSRRDLLAAAALAYRRIIRLGPDELERGRFLPVNMTWNVRETWTPANPKADATWEELVKPLDLSGYRDTTTGAKGVITASGHGVAPKEDFPNLFDDKDTKWCVRQTQVWVQYQYPNGEKHTVTAYTITSGNDAPDRDPQDWRLLGSNDGGKTWTVLDERKGQWFLLRHQKRLFKVRNPGAYNIYRLEVMRNHGNPTLSQMEEIELLEPVPKK